MARIAQRDAGDAVLLRLLYEELCGEHRAYLTEAVMRVHDRRAWMFTHDFRLRLRIDDTIFPHGAPVLFHAHDAVGIMAVEVGLD